VVSAHSARTGKPNKINRKGMNANYGVQVLANCKTVYTSSILVVASNFIPLISQSYFIRHPSHRVALVPFAPDFAR
jgi:hypothetical protein